MHGNPHQVLNDLTVLLGPSRSAELRDVPAILHQLLALSSAGARCYGLRGVCALMESLATQQQYKAADGSPSTPLLQMQATLLVHISTLLKYDGGLATEWHKHFKGGGLTGSPFMLQVGEKAW